MDSTRLAGLPTRSRRLRPVTPEDAVAVVSELVGPIAVQDANPYLDTPEGMAALTDAATRLGTPAPEWIRTSEYVVARSGDLLLRAGHPDVRDWHQQEIDLARAWAGTGVVIRPARPRLLQVPGAVVSAWHWEPSQPGAPAPAEAGTALRRLHETTPSAPAFADRPWRAPQKMARRLGKILAREQSTDVQAVVMDLARAVRDLTQAIQAADATLGRPSVPIHGDYGVHNWIQGQDRLLVCDFATSCSGPRGWDFTLLRARCGPGAAHSEDYWDAFCDGYGARPADVLVAGDAWPAHLALRQVSTAIARLSSAATEERMATGVAAASAARRVLHGESAAPEPDGPGRTS